MLCLILEAMGLKESLISSGQQTGKQAHRMLIPAVVCRCQSMHVIVLPWRTTIPGPACEPSNVCGRDVLTMYRRPDLAIIIGRRAPVG